MYLLQAKGIHAKGQQATDQTLSHQLHTRSPLCCGGPLQTSPRRSRRPRSAFRCSSRTRSLHRPAVRRCRPVARESDHVGRWRVACTPKYQMGQRTTTQTDRRAKHTGREPQCTQNCEGHRREPTRPRRMPTRPSHPLIHCSQYHL